MRHIFPIYAGDDSVTMAVCERRSKADDSLLDGEFSISGLSVGAMGDVFSVFRFGCFRVYSREKNIRENITVRRT